MSAGRNKKDEEPIKWENRLKSCHRIRQRGGKGDTVDRDDQREGIDPKKILTVNLNSRRWSHLSLQFAGMGLGSQ